MTSCLDDVGGVRRPCRGLVRAFIGLVRAGAAGLPGDLDASLYVPVSTV
jgi:hypothetical protein